MCIFVCNKNNSIQLENICHDLSYDVLECMFQPFVKSPVSHLTTDTFPSGTLGEAHLMRGGVENGRLSSNNKNMFFIKPKTELG